MKYYRYAKSMAHNKQPHRDLLTGEFTKKLCLRRCGGWMGGQIAASNCVFYEKYFADTGLLDAGTINDLKELAFVLIKAKHKRHAMHDYHCAVRKAQVEWYILISAETDPTLPETELTTWLISWCCRLANSAFRSVLGRKQSNYGPVITWLDRGIQDSTLGNAKEMARLKRIAKQGDVVFRDYRF